MEFRGSVDGRSCVADSRTGADRLALILRTHLPQTFICSLEANPEHTLTLGPLGDSNSMLWKALRARGGALRIPRVSTLVGCLESDHLCPTRLLRSSETGLTPATEYIKHAGPP